MEPAKSTTSQAQESTFLSLTPFHSTAPVSETPNKTSLSPALENLEAIEPVAKVQRSGSDSSTSSTDSTTSGFLRLAPVDRVE
ncbi:hypothetical protein BAUCODRAFT_119961 [Baudoinia panamericana UAMH 10762]|uniref:Uncharacterized protein n=1 Tax=Baudoinia panamericana (strain UAMH 10762) TaxID=717646 RepID=M2MPI1_BAUPA|nr:uncharacterized protein BAUCODRAFT_119961 [Baudoinia panamericana UAMH 10762]EMC98651.1 hypothetical protein BAUCODRAFT_119961 [Baudoinia panamericana UAMH 10762]